MPLTPVRVLTPTRVFRSINTMVFTIIGSGGLGTSHNPACTDGYNPNHIGVKIASATIRCMYERVFFKKTADKIYILSVDGEVGHWTCPFGVRDSIKYWLDQWGISYTVIDRQSAWWNLLQNPEPGVLVVNTHGEAVPVPPDYGWVYNDVDGWNPDYKTVCYNFYVDLLTKIRDNKWVWIEPIGYTWYNATQNGMCTCQGPNGALGSRSIRNAFNTVFGYGVSCWGNRTYYPTELLKRMYEYAYGTTIGNYGVPRGFTIGTTYDGRVHSLGIVNPTSGYPDGYRVGMITGEQVLLATITPTRIISPPLR